MHPRRRVISAIAVALMLGAGACGDDSGDEEPLLSGEQPEVEEEATE